MKKQLDEITKALKAIDHTQKRYWVDRALAPDIIVEEPGGKIHMPRAMYESFISNTYVKGSMEKLPHQCDQCSMSFGDPDALIIHKRTDHEAIKDAQNPEEPEQNKEVEGEKKEP